MTAGFQIRSISEKRPQGGRMPFSRAAKKIRTGSAMALPKRAFFWIREKWHQHGKWGFTWRAGVWAGGLMIVYILFLWLTLPRIDEETILAASQSTVVTDRNGIELYRIHGNEDRTYIPGTDIPKFAKDAVVAIEDERFFERGCIDIRALARAVVFFGRAGGASTLTRQLARNALDLQKENLISRKLKEMILGCQLEHKYEKEKILELYLNWIPFGQNAYGIEQASKRFLGKQAKDLTLAESAILAGLPQRPTYFSPYGRHVRTTVSAEVIAKIASGDITTSDDISEEDVQIGLIGAKVGTGTTLVYVGGRADQVLRNMVDQGRITENQLKTAVEEFSTITFKPVREAIRAPHFVLWAREQVEKMFEGSPDAALLEEGGLTIQTTLDWELQEIAEKVIAEHKDDILKRFMAHNAALIAADAHTGEILAYVGNTDYLDETAEGKIDMAQVPRQPGSSFKPFVYASAFKNGLSPSSILHDVPTKFGTYEPQNFEGDFWGVMSVRRALGGSRNIPAVKAYVIGGEEDTILSLVDQMGMPTPKLFKPDNGYGAALGIGAAETPLIEMVQGYSTFANEGRRKNLQGILKVTDQRGVLLHLPDIDTENPDGEEVLDPRIAYEVTSVLSDVSARPTEYWQNQLSIPGVQAAAKTGTSNKCLERDEKTEACKKRKPDNVWTMGYTPEIVAGVWVGNATSDPLSEKADGLTVAAPIWKEFLTRAQKVRKPVLTAFRTPQGIEQVQISLLSGQLPTACTPVPLRRSDIFLTENAPTLDDPSCVTLTVDRVTGLLASDSCPVSAREERSFYVAHSYRPETYPGWEKSVSDWAIAKSKTMKTGSGVTLFLANSGAVLPLPLAPTEKCDMSLTPGRGVQPTLTILSPENGGGAGYPSFQPKISYSVGSNTREIKYEVDDKVIETKTGAPWVSPLRMPKSIKESGTHILKITVTDEYYNVITKQVSFTFSEDRSGPSIRVTAPEHGSTHKKGDVITIRAESEDTEGGIKYVELFLDDTLLTRKPSSPYELNYDKIPAGTHSIRAVATDLAGNISEDSVEIVVSE